MTGAPPGGAAGPLRPPRPARPRSWPWLLVALAASAATQVVLGILFWLSSLDAVPAYGDTADYVRLAEVLRVDEYRTLAYPLLLRPFAALGAADRLALYGLQTVVLVASTAYLVRTLVASLPEGAAVGRLARNRLATALVTAVLCTTPLALHYALAVLTDSLASSATVVALAGSARIALLGDRRPSTLAITAAGCAATTLLRAEKAAVVLAGAALAVLVARWMRPPSGRAAAAALVVAVVVPVVAAAAVNRATQEPGLEGRPPLNLAAMAFNRTVWPRMDEVYPRLPAETRAAYPADLVDDFDLENARVNEALIRLRAADGGGDRHVWAATRTALSCCWPAVVRDTAVTSFEYVVAPVTFVQESLRGTGRWTSWNVSRMSEDEPVLARAWTWASAALLAVLLVGVARYGRAGWRAVHRPAQAALVLLVAGTALHPLAIAVGAGLETNLRYAVPGYVVWYAVLGLLVVAGTSRAMAPARLDMPAGGSSPPPR